MKKRITVVVLTLILLLAMSVAGAEVEKNGLLDAAFSMLEKGNIFLERYNEITGSDIQPLFDTGMPYFFGGKSYDRSMANYPQFAKRKCWETTHFYRKNSVYIEGFDCAGYIEWVRMANGKDELPSLSALTSQYGKYGKYYYWSNCQSNKNFNKPLPPLDQIKDEAEVGDIMVIHPSGYHVLMYIGTLRDFRFTAEEVPSLADYLDYPLMIHCGVSPVYGARIQEYMDADTTGFFKNVLTTNGGVQVSIWGVPAEAADVHEKVQITEFDYFLLDGGNQVMTIYNNPENRAWRWMKLP